MCVCVKDMTYSVWVEHLLFCMFVNSTTTSQQDTCRQKDVAVLTLLQYTSLDNECELAFIWWPDLVVCLYVSM